MKIKELIGKKVYAESAGVDVRSYTEDPLQGFMFQVSLDGGADFSMGFTQVGDFSQEVEVVEYIENLWRAPHKLPGRLSVSEVTFSHGLFADSSAQEYFEKAVSGISSNNFRQQVVLNILDHSGGVAKTYTFGNAWFSSYSISGLDASSSDVIIEELTLQYEELVPDTSTGTITGG